MNNICKQRFVKIAHRGASAYEPENTLLSFKRAMEMRADMIELDVRLSCDGRIVVIHDKELDRTTSGNGLVREKTLRELKELDAGKGEKIPTLEEVVDLVRGRTGLVIELKEPGIEGRVVSLVRENDLVGEVFIVSIYQDVLQKVKELEPEAKTGLILFYSPDPISLAKECFADVVAPFHNLVTRGLVEKAHENNLALITWTVDIPTRAEELIIMGVDGIVTNKPDIFNL
ncbi:MAG TPA: glycerophosphodiester phosphodiesterase family protein [Thermodesulfobacteriota bacterium]|nr:glycerophosphodiester phosphodiesterase family protein [Thermodesulfobacteriota bacterium]